MGETEQVTSFTWRWRSASARQLFSWFNKVILSKLPPVYTYIYSPLFIQTQIIQIIEQKTIISNNTNNSKSTQHYHVIDY